MLDILDNKLIVKAKCCLKYWLVLIVNKFNFSYIKLFLLTVSKPILISIYVFTIQIYFI